MDRAGPVPERDAGSATQRGEDLGNDGRGNLLGAVGTDVQAGRRVERGQVRIGGSDIQLGQQPVRPVPWPEHAEVAHTSSDETAENAASRR